MLLRVPAQFFFSTFCHQSPPHMNTTVPMFSWKRKSEKSARHYYKGRSREPVSYNVMRRHPPLTTLMDEENGWNTPPATPRRKLRSTPSRNVVDHSRACVSFRRLWLRLRSLPPRLRWTLIVGAVFFIGLLSGLTDSDMPQPSRQAQPQRPQTPPIQRETETIPQEKYKKTNKASSNWDPVSVFRARPLMVEVASDLSHAEARSIRSSGIPVIMDFDTENYMFENKYMSRSHTRDGCIYLADWQKSHHPTCALFHEIDLNAFTRTLQNHAHDDSDEMNFALVNNGAYRDVWMIRDWDGAKRALKTLRYTKKREFDPRNFERHRRDAVALEQLSGSKLIASIYGFCGNSALADYSTGGDLYAFMESNPTDLERLRVAVVIAESIADAHHFDEKGRATIAHTDIKPNQWISINGTYVLNDFNRARLLTWDPRGDEHCGFTVQKNAGVWRSPEEYQYSDETEKVDVYSMGNTLYYILTENTPFDGSSKEAAKGVRFGKRPLIDDEIRNSTDPYHVAMVKAIEMCFEHDPKKRANARAVMEVLKAALDEAATSSRED